MITEELNKYLSALFDKTDNIYLSFISNENGAEESTISKPTDYNKGMMGNLLSYLSDLSYTALDQLNFNEAIGAFLDLYAFVYLGIVRLEGESDDDYKSRVQSFILSHKVSPAQIIDAVSDYSTTTPEVIEDDLEGAYADCSFADYIGESYEASEGWIMPAKALINEDGAYFFILKLTGTTDAQLYSVVDIVDRIKAAGVEYKIQIGTS